MIRDCDKLLACYCREIKKSVDVAVIGLSGGADSSLTAILCAEALGKERVYGVSMPYNQTDIETFNARSTNLAEKLGVNHMFCPVGEVADAVNRRVTSQVEGELTPTNQGNAKSRARMCLLYGIAHHLSGSFKGRRVRVIGTGNLSEDFIGYDTKGGDALADIFPIGELFKSEVYQFLDYFRDKGMIAEEHIDRIPSAGLEDNQTDEEDLGRSYNEMEKGIRYFLENPERASQTALDPTTEFVRLRHQNHAHKHQAPPVIKTRAFCD